MRTIIIYEEIGDSTVEKLMNELYLCDKDSSAVIQMANVTTLNNSNGIALHDLIRYGYNSLSITLTGDINLSAILVLSAIDRSKRTAMANTRFFLKNSDDSSESFPPPTPEQLEFERKQIAKIISDASGQPLEQVMEDIRNNKILDAESAVTYGLVDKVLKEHQK